MWKILECRPIQLRRRSAMPDEARCSTRQAVRCAMVLRRRLLLTRGNPIISNDKAFKEIIRQGCHMIPPLVDTLTGQQLADINLGFRRFSNSTEHLPTWLKETKSRSNLVTGYEPISWLCHGVCVHETARQKVHPLAKLNAPPDCSTSDISCALEMPCNLFSVQRD